jgi:hypothetical protein
VPGRENEKHDPAVGAGAEILANLAQPRRQRQKLSHPSEATTLSSPSGHDSTTALDRLVSGKDARDSVSAVFPPSPASAILPVQTVDQSTDFGIYEPFSSNAISAPIDPYLGTSSPAFSSSNILWQSSLLDFSSLFNDSAPPMYMHSRYTSPTSAPIHGVDGDLIVALWPTRPCSQVSSHRNPSIKTEAVFPAVAGPSSPRTIDHVTASRMYKHLESGSVSLQAPWMSDKQPL